MAQESQAVDVIKVKPASAENSNYAIIEFGGIRIIAEKAALDGSDNLTFYRDNQSIAHVKVNGAPFGVPNMIRRAIEYGELSKWD